MLQKEFDTRLMEFACLIRRCKNSTLLVNPHYPDNVRRLADALDSQMMQADMIVGGLMAMLNESELALSNSVRATSDT
jgi:hypothetical protein